MENNISQAKPTRSQMSDAHSKLTTSLFLEVEVKRLNELLKLSSQVPVDGFVRTVLSDLTTFIDDLYNRICDNICEDEKEH